MKVKLLYFASVREHVGVAVEDLELPEGVRTVGALRTLLRARGGSWQTAFAEGRVVRTAVNQSIAKADAGIAPGDEIAFFPPVTGG
jgi:molybdopterin synthase sulfur carrier subunit